MLNDLKCVNANDDENLDMTPRYAPSVDLFQTSDGFQYMKVTEWRIYPPGNHPPKCPIKSTYTVLELCANGASTSRWYGVKSGYINSELRTVIVGTNPRDEVRMKWTPCQTV